MFGLAFALLQVTNVGAQAPGYAPGTAPHLPLGDDPSASGSSYQLNKPVNQGGVKGVDPRLHPGMNASTTYDDAMMGATPADISHLVNIKFSRC